MNISSLVKPGVFPSTSEVHIPHVDIKSRQLKSAEHLMASFRKIHELVQKLLGGNSYTDMKISHLVNSFIRQTVG
jgi:hypothetical protein